jgi:Flp pilus assembly protein TadB
MIQGVFMTEDENPAETESQETQHGDPQFKQHVKARSTWLRLFFMVVVVLLYGVSRVVVGAVVVLQFFWLLFTGTTNAQLQQLGQALATYTYQIILYLTFNTEQRPFPFDSDWPAGPPST